MNFNDEYAQVQAQGTPYDDQIQTAAQQYGVSYALLHKQLFMESRFNPDAQSPTGPRGIGQFTKATGRAYGLITDADFHNPAKSIDAAARFMRDNLRMAGGDELKALLLYNQGAGHVGQLQAQAYDRGDFSAISEEGLKYMARMADVAQGSRSEALANLAKPEGGAEAPTDLQASASFAAPEFMHAQSKAQPEEPLDAATGLTGKDAPEVQTPFAKLLMDAGVDDDKPGFFGGTVNALEDSLANSPLGVHIRAAIGDGDFDFTEAYTRMKDSFNDPMAMGRLSDWTEDDYAKLRASALDPSYYDVVLRGYKKNFNENLQLALQNQANDREMQRAGFGAQLAGGAAGMLGDPYSLLNPGRGAATGLAGRLLGGAAVGAATGGLSEANSAKVSGREENLTNAILGGALFGAAANGLLGARPKVEAPEPGGLEGELLNPEENPQTPAGPGIEAGPLEGEFSRTGLLEGRLSLEHQDGDTQGPVIRMMAREKARQAGAEEDPSDIPYTGEEVHTHGPVDFTEVPFEPGAARTPNGSVHSDGSPLNPRTISEFAELDPYDTKANLGVNLGSLSEIGQVLARSKNEDVRGLAYDLFRAPTGYQNGSNGKFGATASDLHERFHAQDNAAYRDFQAIFDEIHDDPQWKGAPGTKAGKQEQMSRRIVEALEGGSTQGLTPGEVRMVERLNSHLRTKLDRLVRPQQFGRADARPLLENTRHTDTYFPQRYDHSVKADFIDKYGRDTLREAIAQSWLASYHARPKVKARVDEMLQADLKKRMGETLDPVEEARVLNELVEEYARSKAYGISHEDKFNKPSIFEENLGDTLEGIGDNNYLSARQLFDSDMETTLPDGTSFSVNDLRHFDIMSVVPAYDRRTNGDVALMGSTGKTTSELKEAIEAIGKNIEQGTKEWREAQAMGDALKLLTGRARRNPDGAFGTFVRSMNDVGFMTKNAYMGLQNFGEAAKLYTNGHLKMLLKDVPILNRWTTAGTKLRPEDMKAWHDLTFGKELDDTIRPSRKDIVDQLRNQTNGFLAQGVGTLKWMTQEAAVRNPFTWLLRETSNLLMDSARQGAMIELAHQVLNGVPSKLFTPERLRAASITPEQFNDIGNLIRKHFTMDADGKWNLHDREGLASDTRAMHLWRLGDRVADETILRPHKMSNQAVKQHGAGMAAAMQFKMFVLRSLNGRLVRGVWEAKRNGAAMDQLGQVAVSIGLSTALYAATVQLKAMGMTPRAAEDYRKRSFTTGKMVYNALSRSSHVGAPFGVASIVGGALGNEWLQSGRTSILAHEPVPRREDSKPITTFQPSHSPGAQDFLSNLADQVPAAGVGFNAYMGLYSAAHVLADKRGDDVQGHNTALWNALRFFVPNDPITQNMMMRMSQESGVRTTR